MPTYQYACTECGEQLEAVQSFSDPALTECPNCQGKLRKVFNSVGIVFKGSGFYRNDSRSGSVSAEKPTAGSGDSTPAKAETSSSSSTGSTSSTSTSSTSSTSSGTTSSSGSSGTKAAAAP
ncbi:putative FmdB family regulatory protein [Actinoplanes xinjiangensis]|uniref:Putative FmdB family regulatory protein n=1 Tax=Actinoplanes xinjiangensis TaxID=512350 RepID=A0A316ETY2_9ACTN|nr:FmdB family zinc ribbon protein [Actinoplanes xinjiangensis]PWK34473.1 putative FmdB family regulatory protein [Actinoplanes xinjiangensis]